MLTAVLAAVGCGPNPTANVPLAVATVLPAAAPPMDKPMRVPAGAHPQMAPG